LFSLEAGAQFEAEKSLPKAVACFNEERASNINSERKPLLVIYAGSAHVSPDIRDFFSLYDSAGGLSNQISFTLYQTALNLGLEPLSISFLREASIYNMVETRFIRELNSPRQKPRELLKSTKSAIEAWNQGLAKYRSMYNDRIYFMQSQGGYIGILPGNRDSRKLLAIRTALEFLCRNEEYAKERLTIFDVQDEVVRRSGSSDYDSYTYVIFTIAGKNNQIVLRISQKGIQLLNNNTHLPAIEERAAL